MNSAHTANRDERRRAYELAALADIDPRTALRVVREGASVVRTATTRERIAAALVALANPRPSAA